MNDLQINDIVEEIRIFLSPPSYVSGGTIATVSNPYTMLLSNSPLPPENLYYNVPLEKLEDGERILDLLNNQDGLSKKRLNFLTERDSPNLSEQFYLIFKSSYVEDVE